MQYQSFLIKYAEIGTKGKNRYIFEDALVHDIRKKLERVEGEFRVTRERGRIYVTAKSENYDYEETVDALQHVFGIVGIFSGGLMEMTAFNFIPLMRMHAGSYLLALGIGLAFSVIFFLSFRGIILALDLKTPGREDHGANRAAMAGRPKSLTQPVAVKPAHGASSLRGRVLWERMGSRLVHVA